MGISGPWVGSLNAPQAARLGVLPSAPQQVAVTALDPQRELPDAESVQRDGQASRAIKLTDAGGAVYWLEYRTASGQDAWLGTGTNSFGLQQGVQLRRAIGGSDTSMLLDATPSGASAWPNDWAVVLPVGANVLVAGGKFVVTVQSVSPAGATLHVSSGRQPIGNWESLAASGSTLSLAGWVYDPDDPAAAVQVHTYVDGRLTVVSANRSRPDVPALSPEAGTSTGFAWSGTVSPGDHTVCLYAIDVNDPSRYTTLGCRTISTQAAVPVGLWESLSSAGSTLNLSGWVYDPDDAAGAVQVHTYVDGRLTIVSANRSRPDVPGFQPAAGTSNGFSFSGSVNPGPHRVCLYAIDLNIPSRYTDLGCRTITTQMALPVGGWDTLTASGSTLSLTGWTFDRDDIGRSVPLHVYVDGHLAITTAGDSRPDVESNYPGVGATHGFSWHGTVAPGDHRVCVYAIDTDPVGGYTALGCRNASTQVTPPMGNWESLSASGPNVTIAGWAFDADDPSGAVPLHVYVDGRLTVVSADGSRPDVPSFAPGAGTSNGFTWSGAVTPGTHTVCIYAIDLNISSRYTGLGCRTVETQVAVPVGTWETLSAAGSTLSIAGWAYDPDSNTGAVPLHVYVDGRLTVLSANGSRPDVPSQWPAAGTSNGFSGSVQVNPGTHDVCIYAIDLDISSKYAALGCRAITTQLALPVGSWETLTPLGSSVSIVGWTFDPDDRGRAVPLHVYIDGRLTIITADRSRPDIGTAFPGVGTAHGFAWSGAVAPGDHRVCVYSIDTDPIGGYTALGCRPVTVYAATPAEAIQAAWVDSGAQDGPLGASLGAELGGLVRDGYRRQFQNGAIYWSPDTGARLVLAGAVRDEWVRLGAEGSTLGYPVEDTVCGLVDSGCGQHFEGGALYGSRSTAVIAVSGAFLEAWEDYGWEAGPLGYPTSPAYRYGDGHVEQSFQGGTMSGSFQDVRVTVWP